MAPPKTLGICHVENCGKPARGRNYCNAHYQHWYRSGTPTPPPRDVKARRLRALLSKVAFEPNSGCWLWLGSVAHFGHGVINVNNRHRHAHRISWELHRGDIPPGLVVCHKCDVPGCVNPEHLFLGTNAENLQDMRNKRRHAFGERAGQAKLTNAQVIAIRADTRPTAVIASECGVSTVLISKIKRGEAWTHLPTASAAAPKGRKLTLQQVREIKHSIGTCNAVSGKYGVSPTMVSLIRRGKTWSEA